MAEQMTRPAVCGLALEARINVRRVERGKHRSGEATPENEKGPPFGEPKSLCLWCRHQESNPGPTDYKSVALPAELYRQKGGRHYSHCSRRVNRLLPVTCGCFLRWLAARRAAADYVG